MITRKLYKVFLLFTFVLLTLITNAQFVANFTAAPTGGCAPLIVRFTDQSTGSPTSWRWDLGNGTISFLQNPSVTYFNPGKYTIKLIVKKANNEDSIIKSDYIEVFAKPTVQFNVSITSGCYPLDVRFTDGSTIASGTITTWLWDFGDGVTSTLQNPLHTYTSARNFNVTLQVRTSNGCISTLTKNSLIQINDGVLAKFTNDYPLSCSSPVTINFQNQSTGTGVVNYLWDFGDGTSSTLLNPSHAYTSAGSFTVKLIVTNSNGCADTLIKPNTITVGSVSSGISFRDSVCQSSSVIFTNTSSPTPGTVLWNFGDGTTSTQLNPNKTFASAGVFTIKMISNFGACTDSVTKTITVISKPIVNFSTTDTSSCKAPYTVNFINSSSNATSYLWNFGNNVTSTVTSPTYTYNTTGVYTVKLTAYNDFGCATTLTRTNYISVKKPAITFTNLSDSGCVPFTKTFNTTINTTEPVASFLWNFGDGNTSTSAAPTNTFITEGTYNITLTVTTLNGCSDSATKIRGIVVDSKPVVNFGATPTNTCANNTIDFFDSSSSGVTKWRWEFGDGTISTLKNPSKKYLDTGFFNIKLIVWKGGCSDSIKFDKFIKINPPIAKFLVKINCTKPLERTFTDQSIGAQEWLWDFGDGNSSTIQNPIHNYTSSGIYNVSLKVTNNTFGCDFTTTKQVQVINAKATFNSVDTNVCKKQTVTFNTGLSLNDISSFSWNYGASGSTYTFTNNNSATFAYPNSGTYTVRLITLDKIGCRDTLTKNNYILVNGPTAKFSISNPGSCVNSAVVFIDSTLTDGNNTIQNWRWIYGDSTMDSLNAAPFQHTYSTPGSYIVSLKVTDTKGCTDTTKLSTYLIISKPIANFTSLDTVTCPSKQVKFVSQSTGPNLTYLWDFGDNTTSNLASPSHNYSNDGSYSVKLKITDQYGCTDSITRVNYIKINSPISNFTMSDSVGNCPPLIVYFTQLSSNAISKKWDFGDSTFSTEDNPLHFYNYPGTYIVKLTITGQGGCTSIFQRTVLVKGPEGSFTYSPSTGCNPVTVNFRASTNGRDMLIWDFNDGNTISSRDTIVTHTYTYPGLYRPKLILSDQAGCQVPIRGSDTITVSDVTAKFGYNSKPLCDSGQIAFKDSSFSNYDVVNSYQWNFGDGTMSTQKNPVHQFTVTGIYYPKLIIKSQNGCTDSLVSTAAVRIVASPKIGIAATANGCTPLAVTFNSQMITSDTSVINWNWNFANGNTAIVATPTIQNYTNAGTFNVKLTGTNSSGCKDSVTKIIEAFAIPNVNAGADFILCKGTSKPLQATGAATYNWSPSTALSCTSCANPSTNAIADIDYVLTGTSDKGCVAKDTISIKLKEKFVFKYSASDSLCKGGSKKLSASGADSYIWTPSTGLDNQTSATPIAQPSITTRYMVVGSDNMGCFKDTGFVSIVVNKIPTVEAGSDVSINVGQPYDLIPVISTDVNYVNWQPTTGVFRNTYPGITVKPTENTEYTVEVKNKGACTAKDRITVFVICNGSNIFVPNTFSPNDDGINEIFYPRGTGLFKIKMFRVYSRWGEVLFEKNNFDANNSSYGWDGTNKGIKLNPDVFVYTLDVICDNGSIITYRGNIALVK